MLVLVLVLLVEGQGLGRHLLLVRRRSHSIITHCSSPSSRTQWIEWKYNGKNRRIKVKGEREVKVKAVVLMEVLINNTLRCLQQHTCL